MLRALAVLKRMSIRATDGDIGSIKDMLFDDHAGILGSRAISSWTLVAGCRAEKS